MRLTIENDLSAFAGAARPPDQRTGHSVTTHEDLGLVVRDRLQRDLLDARRRREHHVVGVLRSLLAAIDNAGAVPAEQAYDLSRPGLGETEVPRRQLDAPALRALLEAEATQRRGAAATYRHAGAAHVADDLDRDADRVMRYLEVADGACANDASA